MGRERRRSFFLVAAALIARAVIESSWLGYEPYNANVVLGVLYMALLTMYFYGINNCTYINKLMSNSALSEYLYILVSRNTRSAIVYMSRDFASILIRDTRLQKSQFISVDQIDDTTVSTLAHFCLHRPPLEVELSPLA
jgi:hypothetical protein